jgi:hypothetical protein
MLLNLQGFFGVLFGGRRAVVDGGSLLVGLRCKHEKIKNDLARHPAYPLHCRLPKWSLSHA